MITSKKTFNYKDKKNLVSLIDQINDKKIYIKLFKFIIEEKISYNKNSNGIFFNLSNIDVEKLNKIQTFVTNYKLFSEEESIEHSELSFS
tara:strand:+ start:68 stop:337 length:270 start_codon:yes stop_codon:yes gene_type:complete